MTVTVSTGRPLPDYVVPKRARGLTNRLLKLDVTDDGHIRGRYRGGKKTRRRTVRCWVPA